MQTGHDGLEGEADGRDFSLLERPGSREQEMVLISSFSPFLFSIRSQPSVCVCTQEAEAGDL